MVDGRRATSISNRRKKRPRAEGDEQADRDAGAVAPAPTEKARDEYQEPEEDEEEARIRELVFGKAESTLLNAFGSESLAGGEGGASDEEENVTQGQEGGFFEDLTGDAGVLEEGAGDALVLAGEGSKGPAWIDEDDANLKVDISAKNRLKKLRHNRQEGDLTGAEFEERLRDRFQSSNMTTDWVKAAEDKKKKSRKKGVSKNRRGRDQEGGGGDSSDEDAEGFEEGDDAILMNSRALKGGKGGVLEPGYLDIVRCKDANQHDPAKAVVRAVSFHPSGELLLTGGFDKTLRLFQVDGVKNPKMHSLFFEDLPITNAMFTGTDQAVITGKRPFFYWYDVCTGKVQKVPRVFSSGRAERHMETFAASPDGRWLAFVGSGGYVLLLSNKTKQWAADFKLNSQATAVSFTPDSCYVLASGTDADVYKFDIRSRRCVLRFFNEGGTTTTSIAVSSSSNQRLTAIGSDSGVVNVYDADTFESGKRVFRPSPLKAVMSLTTPVTTAKFSPDGQMLAIASNQKRDSLKVIHSASCTPFTNWPTERTPVRYPFALDFSPGGGFLAVGNDRGCVLLYRIRHYPQA